MTLEIGLFELHSLSMASRNKLVVTLIIVIALVVAIIYAPPIIYGDKLPFYCLWHDYGPPACWSEGLKSD
jgi:hypothetical protein